MLFLGRRAHYYAFEMDMGRGPMGAPRAQRAGARSLGRSAFKT
jgi:hypothetical protein